MIDRSWAWAKARGLIRNNEMHGEEEARLVLEDGFSHDNERGERKQLSAAGHVEDPPRL